MAMMAGMGGANSTACPNGATPMYMGFTTGMSSDGMCALFLFPEWTLDTSAKSAFAWLGAFGMACSVEGLAYFRKRHLRAVCSNPRTRRALGTLLHMLQATIAYWCMLLVMTYSALLFTAVVLGFTFAHAVLTDYSDLPPPRSVTGSADANDCCLPASDDDDVEAGPPRGHGGRVTTV